MWRTLFFKMPRLAILVVLLILAGGMAGLIGLGRQEDPTLTERYGLVVTRFPGADAARVEALVTEPLEKALMELTEVEELISVSRANVSQIQISVRDDFSPREVDEGWTLIREKVNEAQARFPAGVGTAEVDRLYLGAATIIVGLSWEGEGEPPLTVMGRLARDLEDRFQVLSGTEETDVFGQIDEEIRVVMDPDALAASGLSIRQAAGLIAGSDAKTPAGQVRSGQTYLGVDVAGEFDSISRIRSVPLIQTSQGTALRVGDVARVEKARRDPPETMAFIDNERMLAVAAYLEPNIRVDKWAVNARELVAEFAKTVPSGIKVETLFDQSVYTESRLNSLAKNLAFSCLLVFVVLFFVMGWRAALIVGAAIPLTICLVLILFNVFSMTLHQMSVTGLVISLGLLIDNAIVVVDEFHLRRKRGMGISHALEDALDHLMWPLFASTLTTALAFAPIALMPGAAGEFIGMIGISVIFSVSSSLFVAMTVVAACAAWFDDEKPGRKQRFWRDGVVFPNLTAGYRWTLKVVLAFPPLGLLVGIVPAVIGFMLAGTMPMQFFPATERDQFQIEVTLSPEASIAETLEVTRRATDYLNAFPGIERVHWFLGEGAPRVYYNAFNNQNGVAGYAAGFVKVESNEMTHTVLPTLQREMRNEFPEVQFLTLPYEQGPPANAPIEFFILGPDLNILKQLSDEARLILARTPGVSYTTSKLSIGTPKVSIDADEAAADLAGVRLSELSADIQAELDGVLAGSILEGVEELPVRVVAPDGRRGDLSNLADKRVGAGPAGMGAPLSAIGDLTLEPEVAIIPRRDGQRTAQILGFLSPYTMPAPATQHFLNALEEADFQMPPGYSISLAGEAAERGEAMGNLFSTAIPLIIAMAGCVALAFNSFRSAGLVLITGVLSVCMAFIGVWLYGLPMGFNAIVGAMGLLGVAINGAIVVQSALRASPEAVLGDKQAIEDVTVDATRHIVATTLTTLGGFMPLILSGDSFWLPLATGIAGGVAGSAILALYFTPSAFLLLGVGRKKARKALAEKSGMAEEAPIGLQPAE